MSELSKEAFVQTFEKLATGEEEQEQGGGSTFGTVLKGLGLAAGAGALGYGGYRGLKALARRRGADAGADLGGGAGRKLLQGPAGAEPGLAPKVKQYSGGAEGLADPTAARAALNDPNLEFVF